MKNKSALTVLASIFLMSLTAFGFSSQVPPGIKKLSKSVVIIQPIDDRGQKLKSGSGFILNEKGEIITTRRMLGDSGKVKVVIPGEGEFPVSGITGFDEVSGLVKIKADIPSKFIMPVTVKDTAPVTGDRYFLISHRSSSIYVKGRIIDILKADNGPRMLYLTTMMNHELSGSPIVDLSGKVIGIASFQEKGGKILNLGIPSERIRNLAGASEKEEAKADDGVSEPSLPPPAMPSAMDEKSSKSSSPGPSSNQGAGQGSSDKDQSASQNESLRRAVELMKNDNYGEAQALLRKAIAENPKLAEAYMLLGFCNTRLDKAKESIDAYKRSLELNPGLYESNAGLGWAYSKLGKFQEAEQSFLKAVSQNPKEELLYSSLGWLYRKQGRHGDAVEAYKKSSELAPEDPAVFNNMAYSYSQLGAYKEAIANYSKARDIKPTDKEANYNLGIMHTKINDHTAAAKYYQETLKYNPAFATAHFNLGITYLILNDRARAQAEYKILQNLDGGLAEKLNTALNLPQK